MSLHFKQLFAGTFCLFSALFMAVSLPGAAHAEPDIRYDYSRKGIAYNLARTALKPEYEQHEKETGPVSMAIGRFDLNHDGTPEIIAVLNDAPLFCRHSHGDDGQHDSHSHHHGDDTCPYFVFAYTKRGLVEIARFRAAGLAVSDNKTKGISDLIVYHTTDTPDHDVYKWDKRSYKKEEK